MAKHLDYRKAVANLDLTVTIKGSGKIISAYCIDVRFLMTDLGPIQVDGSIEFHANAKLHRLTQVLQLKPPTRS
jgi:hypothetical protein